jgi:hypothetical protein
VRPVRPEKVRERIRRNPSKKSRVHKLAGSLLSILFVYLTALRLALLWRRR